MEVIEIPTTVLFDEMMKKLNLPGPTYRTCVSQKARPVASVTFYPATRCLYYSHGAITLEGHPMDSLDAANNDAAHEAIKYMKKNEHKILKDYNYEKLNEKKQVEDCHINRRISDIIKEKNENIKQICRYWHSYITSVEDTNDKVTEIVNDGFIAGPTELHNQINSTLCEIRIGTDYIAQLTFESTDLLKQVGNYPCDTDADTSEPDLSDCYPSPPPSPMQYTESKYDDSYLHSKYGLCAMDSLHI